MTDRDRRSDPPFAEHGPEESSRRSAGLVLPRRFYTVASVAAVAEGFALHLDGRPARTPARQPFVLPTWGLAETIAGEWAAAETEIDPRRMPFTRLANSVIDGVRHSQAEVLGEIRNYAASDLLFYRAEQPADLLERQRKLWDPILDWSREALSAPFASTQGIVHVGQPEASLGRFTEALKRRCGEGAAAPFRLGAVHVMTTLTGSAILALAVAAEALTAEDAWALAHVDEDHQIAFWGFDDEAAERRATRWIDMRTAATLFSLTCE